ATEQIVETNPSIRALICLLFSLSSRRHHEVYARSRGQKCFRRLPPLSVFCTLQRRRQPFVRADTVARTNPKVSGDAGHRSGGRGFGAANRQVPALELNSTRHPAGARAIRDSAPRSSPGLLIFTALFDPRANAHQALADRIGTHFEKARQCRSIVCCFIS